MTVKMGPKELALREQREARFNRPKTPRKAIDELREKTAKVPARKKKG